MTFDANHFTLIIKCTQLHSCSITHNVIWLITIFCEVINYFLLGIPIIAHDITHTDMMQLSMVCSFFCCCEFLPFDLFLLLYFRITSYLLSNKMTKFFCTHAKKKFRWKSSWFIPRRFISMWLESEDKMKWANGTKNHHFSCQFSSREEKKNHRRIKDRDGREKLIVFSW